MLRYDYSYQEFAFPIFCQLDGKANKNYWQNNCNWASLQKDQSISSLYWNLFYKKKCKRFYWGPHRQLFQKIKLCQTPNSLYLI